MAPRAWDFIRSAGGGIVPVNVLTVQCGRQCGCIILLKEKNDIRSNGV